MSDIKTTLKDATKDLLTEETLNDIEQAFNQAVEDRVSLHVEKALVEQDEDHAVKLEKLLEAVDSDHTEKLKSVVSAIDKNHSQKLKAVVDKYHSTLNEEADQFKDQVVDNVSNYLELYIDDAIPSDDIEAAMVNKHAAKKLQQMRQTLAVDTAMTTSVVKEAVVDGKKQLDESKQAVETLNEQNEKLRRSLIKTKSDLVLEQMTKELPETKKKYMYKVLGGKIISEESVFVSSSSASPKPDILSQGASTTKISSFSSPNAYFCSFNYSFTFSFFVKTTS